LDWLTFFSTNIKSLAWPTVAIFVLLVLKRQIGDLLRALGDRLLTAKGGGFEFTFGQRVDEAEALLPTPEVKEITASFAASGGLEADAAHAQRIENISALAQLPPAYIVSQAWLRLEQAIREAVNIPPARPGYRRPARPLNYLGWAREQGLLTPEELAAVQRLREMRNLAAHSLDPDLTMTDALRYQDIADALTQKLKERSVGKKSE
jgi:hypothetical protein